MGIVRAADEFSFSLNEINSQIFSVVNFFGLRTLFWEAGLLLNKNAELSIPFLASTLSKKRVKR